MPPSAISAVVALGAASLARAVMLGDPSCRRLFHQHRFRLREDLVRRLAKDPLAPDLEDQGDGQGRDSIQRLMDDSALDASQHHAEAAYVEESGCRIRARR